MGAWRPSPLPCQSSYVLKATGLGCILCYESVQGGSTVGEEEVGEEEAAAVLSCESITK